MEKMPYFVDAIQSDVHICKHLLKNESRQEIHFVSLRGKERFAFCIDCFTKLMKQAGYPKDEIEEHVEKISVPFDC